MRHIGIFSNSGDVQTAIEQETLLNPYVALVSGVVDFNSVKPAGPPMGTWSVVGGVYTFTITETASTYWAQPVKIAEVVGYDRSAGEAPSPVTWSLSLKYDGLWTIEYTYPAYSEPGTAHPDYGDKLDSLCLTSDTSSDAISIQTGLVSSNVISFESTNSGAATLVMTTIDPTYPD